MIDCLSLVISALGTVNAAWTHGNHRSVKGAMYDGLSIVHGANVRRYETVRIVVFL